MQQLTKKALANSLKNLLSKRTLDNITVIDIVRDCGVNRQTFYYHFQDIYDLLEWIFQTEADNAILSEINQENWQECFDMVFHYLTDNKDFIYNVYRSIGRDSLEQYLYKIQEHYIYSVIKDMDRHKKISDSDCRFICQFLSYAIVGVILDWINNAMKEDQNILKSKIFRMLDGQVEKFL